MNNEFKEYINLVFEDNLDINSSKNAFELIMEGNISEVQISSFLSCGYIIPHSLYNPQIFREKKIIITSNVEDY